MRHIHCKLLLALAILLFTIPAFVSNTGVAFASQNRVALIIGNSAYARGPLLNPVNDARAMARTLQRVGFRTTVLENADKRQIVTAVKSFGRELRQADVALFYFSGHGLQHNNHNWMVPIGAEIDKEVDLEFEGVNAERVLAELEGGTRNRVNIVIMDACRVNQTWRSFRAAKNGLANPGRSPTGSLIAFSTAPGKVAWDGEGSTSPYVEELSRHILTPGLSVEQVFKRVRAGVMRKTAHLKQQQVPWENSSLVGDFYFLPSGVAPTPSTSATATTPQVASTVAIRADEEAWRDIKNSNDPDDFRFFLESFPSSPLAKTAEFKLKRLERKQSKAEEERKRQEAEQRRIAEAKRKAEAERKREEELAALKQKQESAGVWTEPTTGMKFRRIPGGSFRMGSPPTEEGREDDERQHTVSVGEFWLGETEVTLGQFRRFVRDSGHRPQSESKGCWWWTGSKWEDSKSKNWRSPGFPQLDSQPVVCVSWNDAVAYAKWLSRKTGKSFRLPTESEWEYAARAGTQTARYWGDDADVACRYASVSDRATKRKQGWGWTVHNCDDGHEATAPVGSFKPNAFGLFDMLGNVIEWTCSEYKESYDGSEQKCAVSASKYSLRGGSWGLKPRWVRAATRSHNYPAGRGNYFGFRLARDN